MKRLLTFTLCLALGITAFELFRPVLHFDFMSPGDSSELYLLQGNPGDGLVIYDFTNSSEYLSEPAAERSKGRLAFTPEKPLIAPSYYCDGGVKPLKKNTSKTFKKPVHRKPLTQQR